MQPVEQQLHKVGRTKQLDAYADAVDRIFRPLF